MLSDGQDILLLMVVDRNLIQMVLASVVLSFRDEAGLRHTSVVVKKQVACVIWPTGHARRPTGVCTLVWSAFGSCTKRDYSRAGSLAHGANLFLTRVLMLVWLSLRYRLNTEYLPQVIGRVPDFLIVIWVLICYTFGETADNGSSGSRPGDPVSVRERSLA